MLPRQLLDLLDRHPTGLPEAVVCRRLDCSPADLTAALGALRREGVEVDAVPLRLREALGWGPHTLSWRTGRPVHHHPTCTSTNRLARDLARALLPDAPLPVVIADHQSAGRGRRGRTWAATSGQNFLFSVILRPGLPPARIPRAILAWAAAMAEVLDVSLKWPNDLVVPHGDGILKLGGILAELESTPSVAFERSHPTVVLGVGINVGQTDFPDLPFATSLARLGRVVSDRARLLGDLVRAIDAVDVHHPRLLDTWRARACMMGRTVRIGDVTGVAEGIREDGALLVDGRPVLAGDVELIAPDPPASSSSPTRHATGG